MTLATPALYAASTTRNIAVLLVVILVIGWLIYIVSNMRSSRAEAGSEIELAPNRKPYYDDDVLETSRLEKVQKLGIAFLVVSAVGLPIYWVREPSRQAGAVTGYDKRFAKWGSELFQPTANGGFNCAGCHGGMKAGGGNAPTTVTDPNTGEVKAVSWNAPALNAVMSRFSVDEVTFILVYGRPFSPMSPWGVAGGGPMNDQQISTLVSYLQSIQLPKEDCGSDPLCVKGHLPQADRDKIQAAAQTLVDNGQAKTIGEALFSSAYSAGAYSCARCHTAGWSYGDPKVPGGGAALGPNLTGGSEIRQFPKVSDNEDFICSGSELGKKYGQQGQGSGRMPGFCQLLTKEQISSIVQYIRGL